jgi:polyhydroxybutyrate depolymerase
LVTRRWLSLCACAPILGCGGESHAPAAGDADAGADADADADSDADTDADGDADAPDPADVHVEGCTATDGEPGELDCTLDHDGMAREYWLHLPAGHPLRHLPLVFDFHGFTSSGRQQAALTGFEAKADAEGFLVVHPEGTGLPTSWNAGSCCGAAVLGDVDDVGFVRAMIERISSGLDVDPHRIYSTGFSNGGYLTHRLGCEEASVFAAGAPVSGVLGMDSCAPSRPFPVLAFHGTADGVVLYDGGGWGGGDSVQDTMDGWAARNGCGATTHVTFEQGDVTCARYDACPEGADVELCTIEGGGHTWPGGTDMPLLGKTTHDLSATDAMWAFFAAHPLP